MKQYSFVHKGVRCLNQPCIRDRENILQETEMGKSHPNFRDEGQEFKSCRGCESDPSSSKGRESEVIVMNVERR